MPSNVVRATRLVILGWLLGASSACNHGGPGPVEAGSVGAQPAVRVAVRRPDRKTLVRTIQLPAQVEAFAEAPLLPKVTGYVRHVRVDIGDRVRGPKPAGESQPSAGDVLVEIDVPELINELAQRNAAVDKARAVMSQSEAAVKVARAAQQSAAADVTELKSAVEADVAVMTKWKSESTRIAELANSGAVNRRVADESASQLQGAEAAVRRAHAKVATTEARLAEAAAAVEKADADVVAARAEVQVAAAELARVETLLGFCKLHAPFDGVITARNVDPGHLVQASTNQPLLVVSRVDQLRVVSDVPEADALLVRPGSKATLRVPSLPGTSIAGAITRTSESLNPNNRTLKAEIDIPNRDGSLKPGTYLQVEIEVAVRENVLALPASAIVTQGPVAACLTLNAESKVVRTPVQLGIQSGSDVEIVSGLTGSESVIAANVTGFREGQVVEAVPLANAK